MYNVRWSPEAREEYDKLKRAARRCLGNEQKPRRGKSSKQEGLFKRVHRALQLLGSNPRHPSLQTHQYQSLENPYDSKAKVFEAYAQHKTPGAYRIFWCYGPRRGEITILAITPHP